MVLVASAALRVSIGPLERVEPGVPPDLPNVPLPAIGLVTLSVAVGLVASNVIAARAMRKIDLLAALRER